MEEAEEQGFGEAAVLRGKCAGVYDEKLRGGTARGEIEAERFPTTGG